MVKDKKARELGKVTLAAIGVVMGSTVDAMRAADVPNNVIHTYLDKLDEGFSGVLWGEALGIMFELVDVLRSSVASND